MNARGPALAAATAVLLWSVAAVAADFTVPPTPTARVTDTAGALSSETRDTVENQLRNYERATGHQVIVWIGQSTGDVPLEDWTGETAHTWKIGRRGHDDGAVLFLFMGDHKVRIEVGYGLESSLTDADSKRIIDEQIVPRMRANDPDGAVKNGVAAILTTITPSFTGVTPPPAAAAEPGTLGTSAGFAIIGLIVLGFAFMIFLVIMQVIGSLRYGYLVMREGSKQAKTDMRHWMFWGGAGSVGGGSSFSDGGGDSDGGGFSAGGGDFGGGGASGGW